MSHLAIITEHYPRLSETFIQRQVHELSAPVYSHTVDFSAINEADRALPQLVDLSQGIPKWWRQTAWNLKVIRWKLYRYPAYHWLPSSYQNLKKALKSQSPSVVLAQFGTTGINAMKVCEKLDIPLVVHFHGKDATQLIKNRFYLYELQQLFKKATALVVVNKYMHDVFTELGCLPKKIHLIPYGVPMPREYPERTTSPHKTFQFLSVGRMVEKKAPLYTLKAFEHAASLHPQMHLTMIGSGELLPEVEEYLRQSSYREQVTLKGALPFHKVQKHYNQADAFVQHSITASDGDAEGWPLAIGEACAAGLPVIATKHMGIPTQLDDGKGGFLVEERNVAAMGEKMAELAALSPEKYLSFSQSAYHYIKEHGDFSVQVGKLRALLENIGRYGKKVNRNPA